MRTSKLYWLWLGCLFLIALPQSAWPKTARLSIEPYLGYSQFSYKTAGSPGDSKLGTILGGKGGVEIDSKLYVALDYHLGGPYLLDENADNEYLNRMWGVGAAVIGKKFRFWGGYYYDAQIDDIARNVIFVGTGIKFSLGLDFKNKLSVNLEYVSEEFTKTKNNTFSQFPKIMVEVIYISISSPLYLN